MARYPANTPTNFELSAPVCVCALLVAGALTKGGHPQWAIGATILLYVLHLAAQWIKRDSSFAHVLIPSTLLRLDRAPS
jgi:hypothetical protein